ncbi:MAG: hypothetical protein ACI4U3_01540 [Traorella sp.]
MKNKTQLYGIIGSILLAAILYFFFLPPINLTSYGFWMFLWISFVPYLISISINISNKTKMKKNHVVMGIFASSIALVLLITFICSPIFNANEYSQRIRLEETDFSIVDEVDFNSVAIIDRDSTTVLGDRTLGQLPELISQFEVSDIYSQISYHDTIVRVTPLDYNGLIKYFTNRSEGIPGYIIVNATTGKSELVKLANIGQKGIKYSENAILFEDRDRHMRFAYPFDVFYETNFEIDEQGIPYWITSTVKYKGIGQKPTISGVIAMNAIDGSMTKYEVGNIPEWIDRVYSSDLIIEQVDQSGSYIHGFFNSIFGQKDVYQTTEGYNYIELNDDIWLYTGITSVNADESNIGFVLINQRTQEAKKIMSSGAEEFSAMSSAEGKVQHLGYTSTFPLLISVGGRPTYLVSLKDNAGLVKMYAMIDCEDYQQVVTVDKDKGLEYLKSQYISAMNIVDVDSVDEKDITISQISYANISGDTYVYIKDDEGNVYKAYITINEKVLPFLKENDTVHIKYTKGDMNSIMEIHQ